MKLSYQKYYLIHFFILASLIFAFYDIYNMMAFFVGISLIIIMLIGGTNSLIIYAIGVVWAKILLEAVNYIEHYGLVRVKGSPIKPFHSWNDNSWMSSILLFNLNRHSAHHEKSTIPYWRLNTYKNYPMLPMGYLSMVYLALLAPPLFQYMMKKKIEDWDNNYLENDSLLYK